MCIRDSTSTVSKQRAIVKYVRSRIARVEGRAFPAGIDELTIEHLHPQSKINGGEWSDEVVGQLGNLILVTKELNDKLENKSFADKKSILMANKYDSFLPDYFWSAAELTPELVVRRTRDIGVMAYNSVWKI